MRYLGMFFVTLITPAAFAGAVQLEALAPQTVNLGATTSVPVTVRAEPGTRGSFDLEIDRSALAGIDGSADVAIRVEPARAAIASDGSAKATLTITTKTSAPSFEKLALAIQAKASSDGAVARAETTLTVAPIYIVNVIQARPGVCEGNKTAKNKEWICDFDTPPAVAYFRPHTKGLQIKVYNKTTSSEFWVHGSSPVEHQPTSKGKLTPGSEPWEPELIFPTDVKEDKNAKGGITLHDIYQPTRDFVVNADTFPTK